MDAPELIIVGGPNGSGKSTFALEYARSSGIRYVGADQIAYELSPADPVLAKIEASRRFIAVIRESVKKEIL
jgi:predicted ABC-type ATPase